MAFKLGPINFNAVAQGVGGLVFGNSDHNSQEDDGGVAQLLERIKNGVLAEDRRSAMSELQDVVTESRSAQLAFGAIGLPIILSILRNERGDLDLVRGALETLVNALGSEGNFHSSKGQVQPGAVNSELLAREEGSAALLLSLLDEEDFYVRYHTLRLLTMLSSNSSVRLQEAVLATPQGITRLMDMLQDREVIRNEALLLLTFLTRSAEEIQKIAVFEGVFEKLFNIILEEGCTDGGIVVQDCLDLLNNILRDSPSNQSFLRETLGLQPVASLLKLRKSISYNFSQQKVLNMLCVLETIALLLAPARDKEPGKDPNAFANQTLLAQNNLLDHLLVLCVEGRVSAVAVHCGALRCIGDLVHGHSRNAEILSRKLIGEEPDGVPALHSILHLLLHTSEPEECIAAEYVIKCFCERNPEAQITLASTITPSPESHSLNRVWDNDKRMSFGSMLLEALKSSNGYKDAEASCRSVRVLTHILKNNLQCKEKVLQIPLEISVSPLASPDNLMSRCMRYLAAAESRNTWLQPNLLRLLVTWLADCPAAVSSFLGQQSHLTYMLELVMSAETPLNVHVSGLATLLIGECIAYNTLTDSALNAHMVVDSITQRVGLNTYFARWEALQSTPMFIKAVSRSQASQASATPTTTEAVNETSEPHYTVQEDEKEPEAWDKVAMVNFYDSDMLKLIKTLEPLVREKIMQLYSAPKPTQAILPSVYERLEGETEANYISRLQSMLQKQGIEMQEVVARNAALTEELLKQGGKNVAGENANNHGMERDHFVTRVELENAKQQIVIHQRAIEEMKNILNEKEKEVSYYRQLAEKHEADLKSLSDAYNGLEQENYQQDLELKSLRTSLEEAKKESETEMNDLLVCLGQEESKVERLKGRLEELGQDVEELLKGIGEEPEEEDDNDDEEEE